MNNAKDTADVRRDDRKGREGVLVKGGSTWDGGGGGDGQAPYSWQMRELEIDAAAILASS